MKHKFLRSFSHSITEEGIDQRLDIFLASQVEELTRSRIQELIRGGFVEVNGHSLKASYRLKSGDKVTLFIPPAASYHLTPEQIDFSVIFEDQSLIVLDKPPGMVVHPAPGHSTGTLVHGLLQHCKDLSGIGGVMRPGIVHRLDKDTSGLIVVAKNDRAHTRLAEQFKSSAVKKKYIALVHGIPAKTKGKIDAPIARHPKKRKEMGVVPSGGRAAVTFWGKMEEFNVGFTLLSVMPQTGRTHQIRVHLSYLGYPIAGDHIYGFKKKWWKKNSPLDEELLPEIKRQMLHAHKICFIHPEKKTSVEFEAPIPHDITRVLERLKSMEHGGYI
ncbi:RluA family pseudouridine synthase [Thermodesulfobacteriota bacterium]